MRKEPLVSVIVCNYNGEAVIGECLDSVFAQSHQDIEVIVVDDGSTDGSCRIIQSYPKVRLVRGGKNRGIAHCRNRGLRKAHGRYIAFLDNDVVLERDWTQRMLEAARLHPQARLFASRILSYDDPGRLDNTGGQMNMAGYAWNRDAGTREEEATGAERVFFPCGAAMFVCRELLEETNGFDGFYRYAYDDVELGWQAHARGYEVIYVPEAKVRHRISFTMGAHNPRKLYYCERGRIRALLKNLEAPLLGEVAPEAAVLLLQQVREELADEDRPLRERMRYAAAPVAALLWNLVHLPGTLWRRRSVQSMRRVSDREMLSRGLLVGRVDRPPRIEWPLSVPPGEVCDSGGCGGGPEMVPGWKEDGEAILGYGWHTPETLTYNGHEVTYRWTAEEAELTFCCDGKASKLIIETLMANPSGSGRLEVLVNGEKAGTLVVPNRPGRHALSMDPSVFNGSLTVRLRALDSFQPREVLPRSTDRRILGVAVSRVAIV